MQQPWSRHSYLHQHPSEQRCLSVWRDVCVWVVSPTSSALDNQVPEHCRHLICLPVGTRGPESALCQSTLVLKSVGASERLRLLPRRVTLPLSPPLGPPGNDSTAPRQSAFGAGRSFASEAERGPETLVSLAGSVGTRSLL